MSDSAITAHSIGKRYRLGLTGMTSFREEIERTWRRLTSPKEQTRATSKSDFWALRDINFDIKRGEAVGLIGHNGSGKSTLLKILSRITEPTEGEAFVHGRVASLLEVGTGFHPELTGRENIFLNGTILGMRRQEIRQKFDEIVDFADVEGFIDTPVKRYSSGMRVRLAFAVAAHLDSEILIIDEVLAVGDQAFQKKCLGKMEEVTSSEGRTVFFVSHNMAAVSGLCPRALWLKNGKAMFDGPTGEAIARYLRHKQDLNVFQPSQGDRSQDGDTYIKDFRVNPNPPESEQAVEFEFEVVCPDKGNAVLEADLAVAVRTEEGHPLMQFHSHDMGIQLRFTPGTNLVKARVPQLPLIAGDYRLNLWLGQGSRPMDWIRDAMHMSVKAPADNDLPPPIAAHYPVFERCAWQQADG